MAQEMGAIRTLMLERARTHDHTAWNMFSLSVEECLALGRRVAPDD